MSSKLVLTQDDSHTLYSEKYKAHYHSIFGSIEESVHVFVSAGLYHLTRTGHKSLSIFEMGLGTGLNAYLSYLEATALGISIDYHAIESDPITLEDAISLNYPELLGHKGDPFIGMHKAEWGKRQILNDLFSLTKIKGHLEEYDHQVNYDLIYFDAFSPSSQAQLWQLEVHKPLYDALNIGGCLVTYCSKGSFRRMLIDLGYSIEKLNGPGKKREMLRATRLV